MKLVILINIVFFVLFLYNIKLVQCWDSKEMQMFDLVEELSETTFYQYLGIEQNASVAEIRRSYRKLSLKYHPDRNPDVEDATKFRRIVSIYEILKDEELREKYNDILKYGLPDWKMPVFYYRKLRKMSFIESFLLFSLLATVIHYACLWGVYFERKLNVEDYFRKKKPRKSKKSDKEDIVNTHLSSIPIPTWKDILPFALVKGTYHCIIYTPSTMKMTYNLLKVEAVTAYDKKYEKQRLAKQNEEEKKRIEEEKRIRKEKKQALSKEVWEQRRVYEEYKKNAMALPLESFMDIPSSVNAEDESQDMKTGIWRDEDTVLLIRALTKYPSGVKDRWSKISNFVKRPIGIMTAKVKEIQKNSQKGTLPINSSIQNSLGAGVEEQSVVYVNSFLANNQEDVECYDDQDEEMDNDEMVGLSSAQRKKLRKKQAKQSMQSNAIVKTIAFTEDVTENGGEEDEEPEVSNITERKKTRKKTKYLVDGDTQNDDNNVVWSQVEQKQLEDAMRSFPKGTAERWDRIAQKIPTKSKVQCIDRIKKLSQLVQNQKQQTPINEA